MAKPSKTSDATFAKREIKEKYQHTNSNIRLEDDEIYIKCALTGYGRLTQKFGA
jgi:hypothetical protein